MTRVDFSFSIGEEARYRVERLPKQLVAKNAVLVCVNRDASATVYRNERW